MTVPSIARSLSPTARCSWFHPGPAVVTERSTKQFTRGWKKCGASTANRRSRRALEQRRLRAANRMLVMTVTDGILLSSDSGKRNDSWMPG